MDAAEKTRWNLANKGKIFGLEHRMKNSHNNNNDICLAFYLSILLWVGGGVGGGMRPPSRKFNLNHYRKSRLKSDTGSRGSGLWKKCDRR